MAAKPPYQDRKFVVDDTDPRFGMTSSNVMQLPAARLAFATRLQKGHRCNLLPLPIVQPYIP